MFASGSTLSTIGIVIFAIVFIAIVVWLIVLSRQVSQLKRVVLFEQVEIDTFADELLPLRNGAPAEAPVAAAKPVQTVQPEPAAQAPRAAKPAAQPAARSAAGSADYAKQVVSAGSPRQQKVRKGHPAIPFGANKEAQARASRVYTEQADDSLYDPDSIDFTRVEGLKDKLSSIPASAQGRSFPASSASASPHQREGRAAATPSGRIPSENARQATAETRASFNHLSEELRSHSPRRQKLAERRQSEQIRRQADSIRQQL